MPNPTDKKASCESCGMPDRPLVKGRCSRCWLLYGAPPEKPKNGRTVRTSGALDHSAFRERLFFVINSPGRVH